MNELIDKLEKMVNDGLEAEEIVDILWLDGCCADDYGMKEFVTSCHEDADCSECWTSCVTKKYFE